MAKQKFKVGSPRMLANSKLWCERKYLCWANLFQIGTVLSIDMITQRKDSAEFQAIAFKICSKLARLPREYLWWMNTHFWRNTPHFGLRENTYFALIVSLIVYRSSPYELSNISEFLINLRAIVIKKAKNYKYKL